MSTEILIHPAQSKILMCLLFKKEARFSEIDCSDLTSDHFNFHLKQLIDLELIEKNEEGKYKLTFKGKEFANRFDTDKAVVERQAKTGAVIVAMNNGKILMQQRLKQPYYGFHGFISGKIRWGERVEETAEREFMEETGLSATFKLAAIEHKMDYSSENTILEDKFFYIFRATQVKGKLVEEFEGGKNIWIEEKKISTLPDIFPDVFKIIEMVKAKQLTFYEEKWIVQKY
jgi:ADP-ribose pyrophosphatase YjhB (NUDIX family)